MTKVIVGNSRSTEHIECSPRLVDGKPVTPGSVLYNTLVDIYARRGQAVIVLPGGARLHFDGEYLERSPINIVTKDGVRIVVTG